MSQSGYAPGLEYCVFWTLITPWKERSVNGIQPLTGQSAQSVEDGIFYLPTLQAQTQLVRLLRPREACEVLRAACLYVCLSAHVSQKRHVQTLLDFYLQHCAQRKPPVFNLLRGRF